MASSINSLLPLKPCPHFFEVVTSKNETATLPLEIIFHVFAEYISPPKIQPFTLSHKDLQSIFELQKKSLIDFVLFLKEFFKGRSDEIAYLSLSDLEKDIEKQFSSMKISFASEKTTSILMHIKFFLLKNKADITKILNNQKNDILFELEKVIDETSLSIPFYFQNIFSLPALIHTIAEVSVEPDLNQKKQKYTRIFNFIFQINENRVINIEYCSAAVALFFSIKEKGTQKAFKIPLISYLKSIGEDSAAKKLEDDINNLFKSKTLKHLKTK